MIKIIIKNLSIWYKNFLSITLLLGSLLSIAQSVKTGTIYDFFSYTWWLAIMFPILFLVVSFLILIFSGNKNMLSKSLFYSGVVYLIINIAWFLVFSYRQLMIGLFYQDYLGFYIILIISTLITIFCFLLISKHNLNLVSTAFMFGTIIFLIGWCVKYVFMEQGVKWNPFLREVSIIAFSSILFISCHWFSKSNEKQDAS